jgi:hypothetical protein
MPRKYKVHTIWFVLSQLVLTNQPQNIGYIYAARCNIPQLVQNTFEMMKEH